MKHIRVSELSSQTVTAQDLRNETRPQELADFCAELERSIRGIKFVDSSSDFGVVAFFPNDVYALGRVAFTNYRDTGDGERMYCVQSNNIVNEKYSYGRPQHNMKMSKNLDVALRNCKKYLRSYSPVSMYEINKDDFHRAVSEAHAVLESGVKELGSKLFGRVLGVYPPSALLSELRGLVVSKYNFIDREFAEDVSTFLTKYDEYKALPKRSELQVSFVRVYNSFSGQQCDIVRKQDSDMVVESHKLEELPEWMLGRLSVLQMMPAFSYVEGVGTSAGDGMFYVVQ
jgi:hypothetical protein